MRKNKILAAVSAIVLAAACIGAEAFTLSAENEKVKALTDDFTLDYKEVRENDIKYRVYADHAEPVPSPVPSAEANNSIPVETPEPAAAPVPVESPHPSNPGPRYPGDVDVNGKIDVTDITTLSLALVDKQELSTNSFRNADVTGDGKVALDDLAVIRQYVSKKITDIEKLYSRNDTKTEEKNESAGNNTEENSSEESYAVMDDDFIFTVCKDHVELNQVLFGKEETVIPDEFNGLPVTVICRGALRSNEKVKTVVIPDTVTTIEDLAFMGSNIEKIDIPDSVTSIGVRAFSGCVKLETVKIGKSVKSIGEEAFDSCDHLKTVSIDGPLTDAGEFCFSFCSELETVNLSDNVKCISEFMFACCENLRSIDIPESVESIGFKAFFQCENLKSVKTPENLKYLDPAAFLETPWFEDKLAESPTVIIGGVLVSLDISGDTAVIPSGVKCISSWLFEGSNIKSVEIPDSVTRIDDDAFWLCMDLEKIELPPSLEFISDNAFEYCNNLKEIIVPDTVKCVDSEKLEALYANAAKVLMPID